MMKSVGLSLQPSSIFLAKMYLFYFFSKSKKLCFIYVFADM